jgi:hypothetical protein
MVGDQSNISSVLTAPHLICLSPETENLQASRLGCSKQHWQYLGRVNPLPSEPLPTWDTETFFKVLGEILLQFSGWFCAQNTSWLLRATINL